MPDSQLMKVARAIKTRRRSMGLSLEELASRAGVSKSFLSKVENCRTIPSMPVCINIARGLHISLSDLVQGTDEPDSFEYVVIRSSEREKVDKEDSVGFLYESLLNRSFGGALIEVSILTIEPGAQRSMVNTDGYEFLFVLEGSLEYHIGAEIEKLETGDALFFDGRLDHVPRNTNKVPARLLIVYFISPKE